jgi:hypothetical protein
MGYVIAAVFLIGLIAALMSFYFFDFLVKEQHDEHAQLWEKSGRPWGFFWAPDGWRRSGYFTRLASIRARGRCIFSWLFSTPGWSSPAAQQKLKKFRVTITVMLIAFITASVLIILRAPTYA